jgi:nitroreductase
MSFENLAKKRASIRKYYPTKKIKIEELMKIIQVGNLAPSPGNLAIIKYLVVQDPIKIEKIAEACRQEFIKDSPYLILICSESKDIEIMYDKRAKKYVKQHVGAAIENMLLYITEMGLASCWIGAFSDLTIKNLLSIPDSVEIEAILPIANQSKLDHTKQKRKPSLLKRIFFESWGNGYLKPEKKFEV